jgi:hypothetical protein
MTLSGSLHCGGDGASVVLELGEIRAIGRDGQQ